jgi:hypothetical protein
MLGKSVDGKGSLRLCGLNPTVRQVFDVAGFTQLFAIFANRDAILAGARPKPARAGDSAAVGKESKSREGKDQAASKESESTMLVSKLLGVNAYRPGKEKIDARSVFDVARALGLPDAR